MGLLLTTLRCGPAAIVPLVISPTTIDLREFLARWYGNPDSGPTPVEADAMWLPAPLRDWYRLGSQWARPLTVMRRLFRPSEIVFEDSRAIFMENPTGDWLWAFDLADHNVVYEAEAVDRAWERAAEDLSELLVHTALSEATYTAKHWREYAQLPEQHVEAIVVDMEEVEFGGLRWPHPKGRIFVTDGVIAETFPAMQPGAPWLSREGHVEIRVAAQDADRLAYLSAVTEVPWTTRAR